MIHTSNAPTYRQGGEEEWEKGINNFCHISKRQAERDWQASGLHALLQQMLFRVVAEPGLVPSSPVQPLDPA